MRTSTPAFSVNSRMALYMWLPCSMSPSQTHPQQQQLGKFDLDVSTDRLAIPKQCLINQLVSKLTMQCTVATAISRSAMSDHTDSASMSETGRLIVSVTCEPWLRQLSSSLSIS